jgi:hypothetical protein
MAELVDALRSGRSGRKAVEVRVLFWAPNQIPRKSNKDKYQSRNNSLLGFFLFCCPV